MRLCMFVKGFSVNLQWHENESFVGRYSPTSPCQGSDWPRETALIKEQGNENK